MNFEPGTLNDSAALLKRIAATILLIGAIALCGHPASAQQTPPLTNLDMTIVGVGIGASPDYQAVPKGINSQVLTSLSVGDVDVAEILKLLPQDYSVRADLSGPAFQTPIHLVTRPGQPFGTAW